MKLAAWALLAALTLPLRPAFAQAGAGQLVLPEASVTRFSASADDTGRVWLRWETEYEIGRGVFHVRRQVGATDFEPVGTGFLRLRGGDLPCAYRWNDPDARMGEAVRYVLVFAPFGEEERQVAEWAGVISRQVTVVTAKTAVPTVAALSVPAPLGTTQNWIGNGPRVRTWNDALPADRVRLSLREAGLYRVTVQELADAGGWNAGDLAAAIQSTNLAMSCQGESVAWLPDGDALIFYGFPAESRYAPENVYWIAPGAGTSMARLTTQPPPDPSTNAWFMDSVLLQGTNYLERYRYSTLADAPAPFVAFADVLNADDYDNGKYRFFAANHALLDCAPGVWTGSVGVNLFSFHEVGADEHACRISIGGLPAGTASWSGERYVPLVFPFSSTNLLDGAAMLSIQNIAPEPSWDVSDNSAFLCVSFGFTYRRLYRARNGALRCTGGEGDIVAVTGLATNDVVVVDVTNPWAPCRVEPVDCVLDAVAGAWTASFAAGGTGQVYQICSRTDGLRSPAVRGVHDTDWSQADQAPQYAVLIPPEAWRDDFRAAVQPLADFRNAQGLRTAIIDVEDLYNAFTHGLADPWAIRSFCAATRPNGLRYVLLAASGSLDYKFHRLSVNDFPACLIPSAVLGQSFPTGEGRIVTIDAALGDADQDGLPDVAVGRLATSRIAEITVAVQKTIAYEGALLWKGQASVAADWNNIGDKYYPFAAGVNRLLTPLANAGRRVITHYVPSQNAGDSVRNDSLFPALQTGSGLFFFFGHTSNLSLGGSTVRLLYLSDITLARWQKPPVAIVMGCIPNRWQSMTETVTFLCHGVFTANTGFVAGLGSTGNMLPNEGEELSVALLTETGGARILRLGDVMLRGVRGVAASQPPERLLCFSLVGDPALVFRHDVTATGTETAWLADRGLIAPNDDLADPDADGWPTWREYQSGTEPLSHVLRITQAHLTAKPDRTLAFESASNRLYQVQTKARLDDSDWQMVSWKPTNETAWCADGTPIPPQGPVTTVHVSATNGLSSGFYRVRSAEQ